MKILMMISMLLAQQTAPSPPATASIEGKLIDAVTGLPVADMLVTARGPGRPDPVKSSDQGAYRISGLGSGAYHILVDPDHGYTIGLRYLHLQPGQELKAVDLKLQKEAVIAGRVLDRDKNPVPGARIMVRGQAYRHGRPTMGGSSPGVTNDLGEYRVGKLMPGSYYLEVDLKPIEIHKRKPVAGKEPPEKPVRMANVRTYYPNAISMDGASPITLRAGEVREAVDVTLLNEKTFCVTSAVADSSANLTQTPMVVLSQPLPGGESILAGGLIPPGNEFEICGIDPGSYRLSAFISPSEGQDELQYASEMFSVGNTAVKLAPLSLQPTFPMSGKVSVAGAKPDDPLPSGLQFHLEPKDRIHYKGENATAEEDSSGVFTFPALTSALYWLDIFSVPSGYYAKQATLGTSYALSAPVFVAPGARLEIVLGADGPSVSGQVTDKDNQPIADATVVLAANPPRSTHTDQDGKFTLSGMPPGDYRIAAFTDLQDGLAEDPNFIQAHLGKATELTLGPSATMSMNLTAQPAN